MMNNLPPGVNNADIEEQAGIDRDCEGNNCGDPADGTGPDGKPYCSECLKQFPPEE